MNILNRNKQLEMCLHHVEIFLLLEVKLGEINAAESKLGVTGL